MPTMWWKPSLSPDDQELLGFGIGVGSIFWIMVFGIFLTHSVGALLSVYWGLPIVAMLGPSSIGLIMFLNGGLPNSSVI